MTACAYFKLSDTAANAYTIRWLKDVSVKRDKIICSLQRAFGADGVSLVSNRGYERVECIWMNQLAPELWRGKSDGLFIGGFLFYGVVPDITTPEGRNNATLIQEHEEQLRKYPTFPVWLCNELGVDVVPNMFDLKSVWTMHHSRDGFGILFEVCLLDGEVKGPVPAECQRIKHSEFVALTEE